MEDLLKTDFLSQIDDMLPSLLRPLQATEFDLGAVTPKFGDLTVSSVGNKNKGVEMNLDVEIDLQPHIVFTAGSLGSTFGVNRLVLKGTLCIVLRPLLRKIPVVGGVQIYFVKLPEIKFDLNGIGNFVDLPIIRSIFRQAVRKAISRTFVLPNLRYIPFTENPRADLDLTALGSPKPRGYLCLQVRGCTGLYALGTETIPNQGSRVFFPSASVGKMSILVLELFQMSLGPAMIWNVLQFRHYYVP